MASLAFGAAGAYIGSSFGPVGAAIGFMIGSLIGNLIDPPKVEGPRLGDLKLQVSTYGKVIPYCFGTGRIAGNCIDQTDLQEHKQKSGGKGGPEVTNYTYSSSFDLLLCVGPILGIKRIWADSRIIWEDTTGDPVPCVVYLGSIAQTPDPTFEAIHGVGNVPGYNGYAHVVFTDYYLTDFGNRIPQFEFEIYTKVGVFPWRVSGFVPQPDYIANHPPLSQSYASGVITVGTYVTASMSAGLYVERQFDIYGTEVTSAYYEAYVTGGAFPSLAVQGITAATDGSAWYYKENFVTPILANPFGPAVIGTAVTGQTRIYSNGYIFSTGIGTVSGDIGIARWPCTNGVISAETGTADAFVIVSTGFSTSLSGWVLGKTNRNDVVYLEGLSGGNKTLFEYSLDLQTLIRQWDLTAMNTVQSIVNGVGFTVYQNSSGDLILACDRGQVGNKNVGAFYLNDDLSVDFIGQVDANPYGLSIGNVSELGNSGYAVILNGVISLDPPTAPVPLSEIVGYLSELTPLGGVGSPTLYDVNELTDLVRWYAISSNMTVRNAIETLRPLFFFDAVESDDIVKFRKRGGTSIATIPDSDLGAHEYGSASDELLKTIRKKEQGLPRTVTMTFYDVDADYQSGAESSPRQVTLSQQDVKLDMPVGLTASEAKQKCWAIQCAEWIEREVFEWTTTLKWSYLEPCDVIIVRGREIRILTRNESPKGIIKWTGVLSAPSIYTQTDTSGGGGFVPQNEGGGTVVPTELVLLDIPILSQADNPFGFYAAMGPLTDGRWPGATLYKSLDGGVTWIAIASTNTASVIGITKDSNTSPVISGVLAGYSGGDVVEETSICVQLTDDDAELESCTATALDNGANLCAISRGYQGSPSILKWELLQFRDAVLVAPRTYIISGFKRGRKNTLTTNHAVGDKFVLLPVTNVNAPESELNLLLKYKAVTFGTALADAAIQDFINTGLSAVEFYDIENEHQPPFTGDTGSPSNPKPGLVPAPAVGDCALGKYLDACGGWSVPQLGGSPTPGSSGGTITILDEGILVTAAASILDIIGPTFSAVDVGGGVTELRVNAAPVNAQYITYSLDSVLTNELVLIAGTNITLVPGGGSPPSQLEIVCTISPGGVEQSVEYTSSGIFNVPTNVGIIRITMIGGGGGGSSRNAAASGGGGGASGEIVVDFPIHVIASSGSPSSTLTITIGTGGTGAIGAGANVAGGDGGTTSVGSFSVLGGKGGTTGGIGGQGGGSNGGAGGVPSNPGAIGSLGVAESTCHFGGSGGSGGGSITAASGGAGRAGPGFSTGTAGGTSVSSQAGGGSGASTLWGQGGAGGNGGSAGSAPSAGAWGAGGGGAGGKATTGLNGGDGMQGYVMISWIA